ncbi:hypothetical protein [Mycolicibacterium sp. D5.8-2]|uniref:hypothetical protein n=1 Tax=Mycolicibacterium sp. D5.8-2 TaxID=3085903 RepID=UPI00298D0108|nr:hypothetical protein [Mycolicibacterium sp. D5.8-2]MDW5612037.1 hypothetical protein [Mycolicibacterium sp. D5.8-2]
MTWVLVALGGAAGTALGTFVAQRQGRRLAWTAVVCALMGAFAAQKHSASLTALVSFGVLGSAASMVALGVAPPIWLDRGAILPTALRVTKRLAVYCAVGVTCALAGYLALRAGVTAYYKFL